jgi:two-component sensor histidine kinase
MQRIPLRLCWVETGGPTIAGPPRSHGVGWGVLDGSVRVQLGGAVTLAWEAQGLACLMEIPLAAGDSDVAGALDNRIAAADG